MCICQIRTDLIPQLTMCGEILYGKASYIKQTVRSNLKAISSSSSFPKCSLDAPEVRLLSSNLFYPGLDTHKNSCRHLEAESEKWVDQYKGRVGQMEEMSDGTKTLQPSPAQSA